MGGDYVSLGAVLGVDYGHYHILWLAVSSCCVQMKFKCDNWEVLPISTKAGIWHKRQGLSRSGRFHFKAASPALQELPPSVTLGQIRALKTWENPSIMCC